VLSPATPFYGRDGGTVRLLTVGLKATQGGQPPYSALRL